MKRNTSAEKTLKKIAMIGLLSATVIGPTMAAEKTQNILAESFNKLYYQKN